MRVVIIGAGIGGLVLAHGLRQTGVEVSVHDRDPRAGDTGGYRLHLDSVAMGAIRRREPPAIYQVLLASGSGPRMFQRFTMFDHQLRPLLHLPGHARGDDLFIGRIPLRTILTHGLDETLRFDHEFTHFVRNADGTVTAHFADGDAERADLLVGADGVNSRVSTALAGRPTAHRLDVSGLAGRTPLSERLRGLLPVELHSGPAFAIGPGGTAIFLSVHDPATAVIDAADCIEVPARPEPAYLLWGAITEPDTSHPQHHERANALFDRWANPLRELIGAAHPPTLGVFTNHSPETPNRKPGKARPGPALGDAIHAMPPTGGRGAATAIRDADHLTTHIQRAHLSTATVPLAIHRYHQEIAA